MTDKDLERIAGMSFDAATAYEVVLCELIVELVEGGTLSRARAANVMVRAETHITDLPDDHLARIAISTLCKQIQRRLALQPDVAARRIDLPKEEASRKRGPKNIWEYEARVKSGEIREDDE